MDPEEEYTTCVCMRSDCWHAKGHCDEPPTFRGGICTTCRMTPAPKRCEKCGQVLPDGK